MIRFLYIIKYLTNLSFLIWSIILILFCPPEEALKNIYIYIKLLQIYLSIIFIECNKEFFKEFWKFLKKYKEINISIVLIGVILIKEPFLRKDNFPINEIFKKIDVNFLLVVISFNIILHMILKLFFQATNDKKDKILYESRKNFLKTLKYFFYTNDNKCILINGEWGIGKTYLIEYFFNVYIKSNSQDKKWIPIWIKTTLFKDKIEIREYIFKEIELILINKGILTYSIKKLLSLFKTKIYGFDIFQETFEVTREKLRNLLKILDDEYIVLIVDDLDRKESKEIKEIISLIAEVEDFFNLKIIYLLDKKNLKIDDNDKDFFEKYFSKKIELHKISYEDIIKAELRNTYPNLQTELINYFKALEEVFLDIFINTEKQDDNEENKKIAKLIEDKINTPRKLIKFLQEFHKKDIEKIEKEANYSKLIIINTYFYYFILEVVFQENKEKIEKLLKKIFIKVLNTYNIKNIDFKFLIMENFIDNKYLEGLINQQENKGLVVSAEEIGHLEKEYQEHKVKVSTDINSDLRKIIFYTPLVKEHEKLIKNIKIVLKKSYEKRKIDLFEYLEIYYRYLFDIEEVNKIFIDDLKNNYLFSEREIPIFFYSIDRNLFNKFERFILSMLGNNYVRTYPIYIRDIFYFTGTFLKEKKNKNKDTYDTILEGLKDFKDDVLSEIIEEIDKKIYNSKGYQITSSEKSEFNKIMNKVVIQVDFLINIFQQYEEYKNSIWRNSSNNIQKLEIQEMKTVDEIIKNLIDSDINIIDNYHILYSYTGLDIVRNLEHIKNILKNNKDYLYLLLSRFGLDIEGNRIPHKIYNEVIESLNRQKVDINYEAAYFQGEINQEKNKIVKEYIIKQKLEAGEELKENEIVVLRVDYIENNEDKLLYIGTIGEPGKEKYIKNSLGEVIFYIP